MLTGLLVAALALAGAAPHASARAVQKSGLVLPPDAPKHAAAAKKIFTDTYSAYREFAWGHDDLTPESKSFADGLGGWGASMVDAMDTMLIMGGLDDWFEEAVNRSASINFNVSATGNTISIFETTIRYVGGFLAAYELSGKKHEILVEKAKEVASKLVHGFDGATGVNYGFVDFSTNSPVIQTTNIAEAGTLTMEWDRLSLYTGNDTFQKLALQSAEYITTLPAPLPGLAAQGIDPSTGEFVGAYVTWGGGSDSYFEYLLKYPRLTNANDDLASVWATAVDSSIKTLLSESTVGEHFYLADQDDDGNIRHIGSHLACFHGGNWLLGGQMMNNDTVVKIALDLVEACWNTYASETTGIGPEAFAWFGKDGNYTGATPAASDLAFYADHGFFNYPGYTYWLQRPEVMESNFYAYRVTGESKYLDRAAQVIESIQKYTRASETGAYAPINDITSATTTLMDDTQSFFFAEVMKYLFLTFDDPKHISLNDFIFNTEAHPFIAPPAKATYGNGPDVNPSGARHASPAAPANPPVISPNSVAPKPLSDLYKGF